jgi:hypothetical protein
MLSESRRADIQFGSYAGGNTPLLQRTSVLHNIKQGLCQYYFYIEAATRSKVWLANGMKQGPSEDRLNTGIS